MIASTGLRRIGVASALAILLLTFVAGTRSHAQSPAAPATDALSKLRILYAGRPGSGREKDFVRFLKKYFDVVQTGNLQTFKEADTQGFDITLLDWDSNTFDVKEFPLTLSPSFSRPVITLGTPGGDMCSLWRLKTGYL